MEFCALVDTVLRSIVVTDVRTTAVLSNSEGGLLNVIGDDAIIRHEYILVIVEKIIATSGVGDDEH